MPWPHRLSVRTPGFQPGKRGSTPLGAAKAKQRIPFMGSFVLLLYHGESNAGTMFHEQLASETVRRGRDKIFGRKF